MTIRKRVVLSQIEITPDGTLQVRLDKQVVEGDQVLSREYHRTAIPPGTKVQDQMAFVNAHLAQMGWPDLEAAAYERIKRIAKVEHTREVVKAHHERVAAADRAAREAEEAT